MDEKPRGLRTVIKVRQKQEREAEGTQGGDPMKMILVVCGAGASSTFLANRMRTLAGDRGLDQVTARAASNLDLPSRLADAAVLLVGPHLERDFPALEATAAEFAVPAALLPSTAFGPTGASAALDLALSLLTPDETSALQS